MLDEKRWQRPCRPAADRHDNASQMHNACREPITRLTCVRKHACCLLYELPEIGFAARRTPAGARFAPRSLPNDGEDECEGAVISEKNKLHVASGMAEQSGPNCAARIGPPAVSDARSVGRNARSGTAAPVVRSFVPKLLPELNETANFVLPIPLKTTPEPSLRIRKRDRDRTDRIRLVGGQNPPSESGRSHSP